MKKILAAIEKMEIEDELMEQLLDAIEAKDYEEAAKLSREVLLTSDGIERRLAALCIQKLCEEKDDIETDVCLEIAYWNE